MIASPGDIADARDAVEKAIHGWNDAHARAKQIILQPWRWETSSVPILGGHPQALINSQGVDDSDIVFALFGGRLGSPTPEGISGTAEEIDRAQQKGIPVHLYFSTAPLPTDIDTAQLDALRRFKAEMQGEGLLGEFSNTSQLEHEVWRAIEHDIASMSVPPAGHVVEPVTVDFRVQPQQEREVAGVNSKGAPRYTTRHWIEVTNVGSVDAVSVTFESVSGSEGSSMHVVSGDSPTTIHAGQTRRVDTFHTMGGGEAHILRISWVEADGQKHRDYHVG